jgi:hypothetical protein
MNVNRNLLFFEEPIFKLSVVITNPFSFKWMKNYQINMFQERH